MKRRIFVCILALCMILTAMPVAVYAEEPVGENEWNSDCPVPHQYVICGLCEDAQCEKCNGGHSTFKCVVYQEASCEQPKKYAHICNCCGQMMGSGEDSLLLGISKAEKAFGHTFVDVVVLKEGSCDVAGIKKQECTTCGKIEYVTFYSHDFEVTVIEATCTEPAKVGEKCTVCGQEGETEVVAGSEALGHDLQLDTENEGYVAATCEEGGHDTLKCSRCDYTEEKDTEALGHQYDEGVHTEATCEDASGVLYTCEVCGATKVEEYPPEIGEEALGHDYEAEVTEPTCAAGGYTTYTCTRCGDSYTADETEADPEAHVWNEHVLKEATCTTPGIVRKTCELCGVSTVESILAEHQWSEDMAGNACVYRRCEICGAITIVATFEGYEDCEGQHTPVDVPEIPATNETEGRTAGKVCSVCGVILEGCDTIPVLDHTHEWDEGVVTLEPTCTAAGKKIFTCFCGATREEEIPASGHAEETLPSKAATCTEDGLTEGKKCSVCGEILVAQETIPANGHAEETLPSKAATCTEDGLTEGKQCSVCGEILVAQETIPANGHAEETLPSKAATCTETGLTEGKQCSVCGAILVAQETIPAAGHSYTVEYSFNADYTKRVATYTCSICQDSYSVEEDY